MWPHPVEGCGHIGESREVSGDHHRALQLVLPQGLKLVHTLSHPRGTTAHLRGPRRNAGLAPTMRSEPALVKQLHDQHMAGMFVWPETAPLYGGVHNPVVLGAQVLVPQVHRAVVMLVPVG